MHKRSGIYLGTDDFADLLLNSDVFVDKSLFIKEFLEDSGKVALITRPRRWGKSLNMSMLSKFLAIEVDEEGAPIPQDQSLNRKLFAGGEVILKPKKSGKKGKIKQLFPLKIAKEEEIVEDYQGQYPVISLGLKDVKGDSYDKIEAKLKKALLKLFQTHHYLLKGDKMTGHERDLFDEYLEERSDEVNIQNSLYFLSELLHRHFKQPVYILVDEYDTPINHAYLEFKEKAPHVFKRVVELFRELLGKALKSNEYLEKGLVTGILRIAKANLFSETNNVLEYTLLDRPFATSYGFTQTEVNTLLSKVPTDTTLEQIQYWYNGYTFGGEVLYNPWSIMCCLGNQGELDHYWVDSGGTSLVDAVLLKDEVQGDLQRLAMGESLEQIVEKKISFDKLDSPDGLYSLLLFSGYLNPEVIDRLKNFYKLSIPNHEVAYIYQERILAWVEKKLQLSSGEYIALAKLLVEGKAEEFKEALQEFLKQGASFYQTGCKLSEVFYSGFMMCLLSMLSSYYRIEGEYESGSGRADMVLIPKSTSSSQALILEYKVCKEPKQLSATAEAGLKQILDKDYATKVRSHEQVERILVVSLAFCGKEVALASKLLESPVHKMVC